MATDTLGLAFVNGTLRPVSDELAAMRRRLQSIMDAWYAQQLIGHITASDAALADGSPADGRPAITGNQAITLVSNIGTILTALNTAKDVILAVSPNPTLRG